MAAVRIKDTGFKKFDRKVRRLDGGKLTVGIHKEEGAANHSNSTLSVAEVYGIHEFGLGNNPERSWLRAWVDENERKLRREINRASERSVDPRKASSPRVEMNKLGVAFVGSVQERISGGIAPPNAAATVARKGSSTPLIDTGQSRQSIRHKVTE